MDPALTLAHDQDDAADTLAELRRHLDGVDACARRLRGLFAAPIAAAAEHGEPSRYALRFVWGLVREMFDA